MKKNNVFQDFFYIPKISVLIMVQLEQIVNRIKLNII